MSDQQINTAEIITALSSMIDGSNTAEQHRHLERILARYPFFTLAEALMVKNFGTSLEDRQLSVHRTRCALGAGDTTAMTGWAGPEVFDLRHFYPAPETKDKMSTDKALDIYSRHFMAEPDPAETALLEKLISNPTVGDYSELLAREQTEQPSQSDTVDDETSRRIDMYLTSAPDHRQNISETEQEKPSPSTPDNPVSGRIQTGSAGDSQPADDTFSDSDLLSESLAKFYIRQGRYERAYKIISSLSLKYPKKSVYFADQLRFLQKLVRLEQLKRR